MDHVLLTGCLSHRLGHHCMHSLTDLQGTQPSRLPGDGPALKPIVGGLLFGILCTNRALGCESFIRSRRKTESRGQHWHCWAPRPGIQGRCYDPPPPPQGPAVILHSTLGPSILLFYLFYTYCLPFLPIPNLLYCLTLLQYYFPAIFLFLFPLHLHSHLQC